jgi:NitT/TauT family transport system substrate-binding protein/sulfonate transport system substrate-binding protein
MRTKPLLVVALAGVLALGACGGEDEAPAAGETYTLRVGAIGNSNQISGPVGYLHSKDKLVSLLAGEGVAGVKVVTFPNGPDLNQALAAGELDLAVYGDTPALVARGAGQSTRLVAQASINLDASIVSRKEDGPATLTDLAGKKVAVQTGSYIHRYLLGALADAGVKPAEVVHIYSSDVEAALERGDVDAAAVPAANASLLAGKGYPVLDHAAKDHPRYLGTSAAVVTEKFLAARPGIVAAWQKAQREATRAAKADWDGFLAWTVTTGGFPAEVVKATTLKEQWQEEPFTDTGLELLGGTKAFLKEQNFLKKDVDIDDWIAPGARPST